MMLSQELMEYITGVIKSIVRSGYMEVAVYSSNLLILLDDTVLYTVNLSGKIDPNITCGFTNYGSFDFTNSSAILIKLIRKQEEMQMICTEGNVIYNDPTATEDKSFYAAATLKATEGASFYFINNSHLNNNIFIPLFSGLLTLNKGDTVGLSVFKAPEQYQYIANMVLFKKKINHSVNIYYRVLDVNRPLRE